MGVGRKTQGNCSVELLVNHFITVDVAVGC